MNHENGGMKFLFIQLLDVIAILRYFLIVGRTQPNSLSPAPCFGYSSDNELKHGVVDLSQAQS